MQIKALHHSDATLLSGILHADPVQLNKLYADFLPGIIRYIKENNGTEAEARDIFQDAVMVIYRRVQAGGFILDVSLQSFLFAICRNMWLSQLRYKRGKKVQPPAETLQDADADTLMIIEKTQREQLFYKHFLALGDKCREILTYFFNEMPMKDIADLFQTSESYIKKRKHLCKEQLVEAIKNDERFKEMTS